MQAQTAARAAAADAGSGSPDPLSHIRRLLAAQGGMPPAGTAATTILARPGRLAALARCGRLHVTAGR